MTDLCMALYRDFGDPRWTQYELETLPNKELEFLSRMAGIAHSGTKEKKIVRLLSCRIVRQELSRFADDPAAVTAAFRRDRLRWMCIQANLWRSGPKLALAAVLLNWRNRCRHTGQVFYRACVEWGMDKPRQLQLI